MSGDRPAASCTVSRRNRHDFCIVALQEEYGPSIAALAGALAAGDERALLRRAGFARAAARARVCSASCASSRATCSRRSIAFSVDSRLVDLAEKEVPDARHRLDHVLKLTDEAAHRTMDLVEQSGPLAERTAREAADARRAVAAFPRAQDRRRMSFATWSSASTRSSKRRAPTWTRCAAISPKCCWRRAIRICPARSFAA